MLDEESLSAIQEGQKFLETRLNAIEDNLQKTNQYLPLTMELLLKHFDILLETARNFLIVSSTIFVTARALDQSQRTSINIDLIREVSMWFVAFSIVSMVIILWRRNGEKNSLLENFQRIENTNRSLLKSRMEILDLAKKENIDQMKEIVRKRLRKNEGIMKSVPDL